MKHGFLELAAAVLEAVTAYPDRAPTRIMASAGVAYAWLPCLKDSGLVEVTGRGHYGRRLRLTAKGQDFLRNYRVLEQLLP
jgi:predicted transcriptional regulator